MSRASSSMSESGSPPPLPPPSQSDTTSQSASYRESRRIAKMRNPSPDRPRPQVQAYVEPAIEEFCDPESDSDVAQTVSNFNDANKKAKQTPPAANKMNPSHKRSAPNDIDSSLPTAKKVRAMTEEEEITALFSKNDWEDTDQQDFDTDVSTSSKPSAPISTVDTHGTSRQPLAPKAITSTNIKAVANGQKQGKVDVIADKENIAPFSTADQLIQDGKKQGKVNVVFNTNTIPPLITDEELPEGVLRARMYTFTRELQEEVGLSADHRQWPAAERALARNHLLRKGKELYPRFIQGENLKAYMSASKKVSYLDALPQDQRKKQLKKRESLLTEMEAAKKDWNEQQEKLTKLSRWVTKIPTFEDARDAELEHQQREKDEAARKQPPKPEAKKPATQKSVKPRKAAAPSCASTSTKRQRDDSDDEDDERHRKQSKQSKERSDESQRPKKAEATTRQPSKPAAKQPANIQTVKPLQSAIQQPSQLDAQQPPQPRQPAASNPLKRQHTSDVDADRQEKRARVEPRRPHFMDTFLMGVAERLSFPERKEAKKAAEEDRRRKQALEAEEERIRNRKAYRGECARAQRYIAQYKAQYGVVPLQIPPPPARPSSSPSQSSNRRDQGRSNDRGSASWGSHGDRRQDSRNGGQRELHRDYRGVISRSGY